MRYLHLYNDADGAARFGDGDIPLTSWAFAPPAPPLDVSELFPASEMMLIHFPAGWTDAHHPAPARQWQFVLSGHAETTASGETRSWGAGDVILVEDTGISGHSTTAIDEVVVAVIRF